MTNADVVSELGVRVIIDQTYVCFVVFMYNYLSADELTWDELDHLNDPQQKSGDVSKDHVLRFYTTQGDH